MKSPPPRSEAAAKDPSAASAESGTRAAWATVDLAALAGNLAELRRRVAPAGVLAVVKADAYGHGAVPVARTLERGGVDWLGVGEPREGMELRRSGVETPILVLGVAEAWQIAEYGRFRLTPTLSSLEQIRAWAEAAPADPRVHLKVDTGMSRLGIEAGEMGEALELLRRGPLQLAGLLSHFAEADEPESDRNREQQEAFEGLLLQLQPEERRRVSVHMANSGAALHRPAARHHLVRLGLALYGLDPARRVGGLAPVLAVAGRIVLVRRVDPGARAGYGGTWRARRPSRIAVVPLGYGDGYPWRLSQTGEALVCGRRVPLAGRVSMDMILLDVTDAGAELGDEVVVLGRQGSAEITAWELAERAGTIPWEILCGFGLRLPRRIVGESA